MSDIGRKRLISELEGILHNHVENNDKKIRYPITFDNNKELRGKCILDVTKENSSIFYSGRYQFGANALNIYQAIDSLLDKLVDMRLIPEYLLDDMIKEKSDHDEDENEDW